MAPMALVIARLRHSGPTTELSEMPAATVHPVSGDLAKLVISGTPSRDTVCKIASEWRNIAECSDGEARLPTVSCGFGTRPDALREKVSALELPVVASAPAGKRIGEAPKPRQR